MDVFLITSKGTGAARPLPFRPLSRSLGLLPSIALSRPTQVGSVSIEPLRGSTKKQRTATTPLTRCLTFGVHFRHYGSMGEEAITGKRLKGMGRRAVTRGTRELQLRRDFLSTVVKYDNIATGDDTKDEAGFVDQGGAEGSRGVPGKGQVNLPGRPDNRGRRWRMGSGRLR